MNKQANEGAKAPGKSAAAFEIRQLIRSARHAGLATLDHSSAGPFASLIITATAMDGAPVTCLSSLAWHSANLERDPRASLLFASGHNGDVLAQPRVTLTGRLIKTNDASVRKRFLAAHPAAEAYADFTDFSFYRLMAEQAHLVAGFGRIQTLDAALLALDGARCAALAAIEDDALEHMAGDHGAAVRLYASALLGLPAGDWRMTGIDPEGADLACGELSARLIFPEPAGNARDLRTMLARLADEARAKT